MPTATTSRATPTIPAGLEAHLASRTPAWAARITGLPEEQIVEFARLYGAHEAQLYPGRLRLSRQRNGAAQMFAVDLPAGGDRRLGI